MFETVTVRRVLGRADFRAGKFAQRFGAALDEAPGSYGREFAESYELESGWGVEGTAPVSSERWGFHRISAGVWTGDRSFLRRGLFDRADEPGAPGPAGWRIGLDSEWIPVLEGFKAHASYVERIGGVRGFALAARHDREIGSFALDALVEFASLHGAHRERYATASTAIRAGLWQASLSHSLRDTGRGREHQVGVELRRDLGDGLHIGAGWQKSAETGSGGTLELRFDFGSYDAVSIWR